MIVDDQTGVLLGYRDGHGVDRYLDGRVMQGDEHGDGPPVGGLILTTQNGLALVTIQGEQFAMLPVDANGDVIANTNATGPGVCVFKGSSSTWALRTAL